MSRKNPYNKDPFQPPGELYRDYSLPDKIRCRYTNNRGDRCEYRIADPQLGFCILHHREVIRKMQDRAQTLADRLFQDAGRLQSPQEIRGFVVELMHLLAEQRIDRNDAGILVYGCGLLLQTLSRREEGDPRHIRRMLAGCGTQQAEAVLTSASETATADRSSDPFAPISAAEQLFARKSDAESEDALSSTQPASGEFQSELPLEFVVPTEQAASSPIEPRFPPGENAPQDECPM